MGRDCIDIRGATLERIPARRTSQTLEFNHEIACKLPTLPPHWIVCHCFGTPKQCSPPRTASEYRSSGTA